jgi:hypothetical protein
MAKGKDAGVCGVLRTICGSAVSHLPARRMAQGKNTSSRAAACRADFNQRRSFFITYPLLFGPAWQHPVPAKLQVDCGKVAAKLVRKEEN